MFGMVFIAYINAAAMNWFLFWPVQITENNTTCLMDGGSDLKYISRHVPISHAPRPSVPVPTYCSKRVSSFNTPG